MWLINRVAVGSVAVELALFALENLRWSLEWLTKALVKDRMDHRMVRVLSIVSGPKHAPTVQRWKAESG